MDTTRRVFWFRRLALAGALLAAGVVVLGAWVRLTDAGLGCPDWPGCYGHLYPAGGAKALNEMIHRYFATSLGLLIVVLFLWAVRFRGDDGQPLIPAALLFLVVCVQGALGALTVTLLLKPLIVTAHLLGGLTTLGLLWWLSRTVPERPSTGREAGLQKFAWVGLAALIVQIALGGWTSTNYAALACPDLPTCQHSWWPQMDYRDAFVLWRGVLSNPARVAIHFSHRLGALLAGSVLITLGVLSAVSPGNRRLAFAGRLLVVAVVVQISIGAATVHWGVPLALATLHNAGAAFLAISMVTLLRALRPAAAISMVPLNRADSSR